MPAGLLSVVMPTHNRPDQLFRAAQSVLSQTTTSLELVIVNDASTDHTPDVPARLAGDARVKVLRNETSVGPGGARNQGVAAATGDLLGFCDDDDAWLPDAAAPWCGARRRPELGFVTSWHRVVHDPDRPDRRLPGTDGLRRRHSLWFNFVALPFGVIRRDGPRRACPSTRASPVRGLGPVAPLRAASRSGASPGALLLPPARRRPGDEGGIRPERRPPSVPRQNTAAR